MSEAHTSLNCLFPIAGAAVLARVDKSKLPALIVGFYMIFIGTSKFPLLASADSSS